MHNCVIGLIDGLQMTEELELISTIHLKRREKMVTAPYTPPKVFTLLAIIYQTENGLKLPNLLLQLDRVQKRLLGLVVDEPFSTQQPLT